MTTECPKSDDTVAALERLGASIAHLDSVMDEIRGEAERVRAENEALRGRVAELEAENARLRGEG